ncbi:pyrroline-5-carboxylate reductase [Sphingomonas radiodurans]|uniref:pyrroline-5-carboxylate reductase n=1 Tax=Sphingomonas radiodurans TaxID=2890321 RepID=UPI001E56037F|nr:pyrroline-5-carboxylate reductase [Sphingomonas radiodurans]WBH16994.1 pyrroline-5-carboxylate reductase [Sphingomonas radiodurans]
MMLPTAQWPESLWLVGCGNMGGAMLRGWIAAGMAAEAVTVIDPGAPVVPSGVRVLDTPPGEAAPEVLVLAVKPQLLDAVAPSLAAVRPALLLSILAGVEEETLATRIPAESVVRAMPNLPVAIGKGVTALHAATATPAARTTAEALVTPLGAVEWISGEALFDAVTALSGCGPGFVFRFIDALAQAGAALGLPADQAARLALATVEGSAAMAAGAGEEPAVLADRVASPGGSTREGLNVLDRDGALNALLAATLAASRDRNAELAAIARTAASS